jgi:outer membrane immunogenic protein
MKQLLLATTALVMGGQAFAADMRMPVKAPPPPPPAYSWTGCSIGGHVGAGWGRASFTDPNASTFPLIERTGDVIDDLERTGALGGVQAGCDYQFASHWVVGVGGDFSWANIQGQATDPFFVGKFGGPITLTAKTDWLASATARVGYGFDRFLLYARGGFAWSHDSYGVHNTLFWGNPPNTCAVGITSVGCNATGTATRTGYAVGLGFEWAFVGNWTAGVEFDHYGFGTKSVILTDPNVMVTPFNAQSAPINIKQNIETAKITLSYRFGGLF